MNRNNDRIKRIVASAILLFLSGSYDIMNIKFAVGGKNPSAGSRPQLSIRSVRSYYRPQEPGENPPEKIPRCKSYDGFYQLFNQWNQPWQCLRDHRACTRCTISASWQARINRLSLLRYKRRSQNRNMKKSSKTPM